LILPDKKQVSDGDIAGFKVQGIPGSRQKVPRYRNSVGNRITKRVECFDINVPDCFSLKCAVRFLNQLFINFLFLAVFVCDRCNGLEKQAVHELCKPAFFRKVFDIPVNSGRIGFDGSLLRKRKISHHN
jgi:hypothetical protein